MIPLRYLAFGAAGASAVGVLNQLRTLVAHRWRHLGDEAMTFEAQFQDSVNVPGNALVTPLWAPVGLRFHVLDHGDPRRKWLALTFDDGPHPAYTPKLLAILKQYNVRATFFLVGKMAEQYPDLVRAEMAAGHELGNHTYHHVNLLEIPVGAVATEIKACGEVIQGITGQAPGLFRPPGGDYDKRVAETAESLGYTMVLWTDDPADYASPGVKLVTSRVLCDLSDGGIVLLHDGVQQTVDLLAPLLAVLKAKGYEFVTADEMLPQRATPAPRPGKS